MTGRFARAGGWIAAVVTVWLVAGYWAAGAALILGIWDVGSSIRPRLVLAAALALVVAVPVVWLLTNDNRLGLVSFDLVARAPWPGRIAAVALTLLSAGVFVDVSRSPAQEDK